jgi:Putative rhamnosyl transferase
MVGSSLPHFVVTRLGIGVRNDDWFQSTLGLFEAITFPSLCAQSSSDFTSLLIVGHDMPPAARARLDDIVGRRHNFHIVPINLLDMRHVRQGCFDYVWECCRDYLLAKRLVSDPFGYITTSVLDSDDGWHHDIVALVRQHSVAEMPELLAMERNDRHWRRHTGGMCLTFPNGLRWFAHCDVVRPLDRPYIGMSVFVTARFSSAISACSSRHLAWREYCEVLGFKTVIAEAGRPLWVNIRHDLAETSWDAQGLISDSQASDVLRRDFGIDFAKVDRWRDSRHLQRTASLDVPLHHAGNSAMEQLDCYFRITALNRQIAALEHEAELEGLDESGRTLLETQRALREELRALYRSHAVSIYR